MIARVAVFTTLGRLFDYLVSPDVADRVRPGVRVWVPWRTGALEGIVWELVPTSDRPEKLKTLSRLVEAPPLDPARLELARWIAEYYVAPPGEVARLFLPVGGAAKSRTRVRLTDEGKRIARLDGQTLVSPEVEERSEGERALLAALRRGPRSLDRLRTLSARAADDLANLEAAGLVDQREELVAKTRTEAGIDVTVEASPPPTLNAAQRAAVDTLVAALSAGVYAPHLLHGVTGSGKTEVYLHVIASAIDQGRRALVLVPEIALTPQLTSRFEARFGNAVAVLHSGLSDRERQIAWARLERGEAAIALGARSAVFAPQPELGVVVVDEEHDPSFKQDDGVRYQGRDVAMRRARAAKAVVVLGSATPSMETYAAAKDGRLRLLVLPERAAAATMPPVDIIDMKVHKPGLGGFLSFALERALEETLANKEQSILFLNRRGYSTFVLCKACGLSQKCRDCAVSLTFHRGSDALVCHYCGFRTKPPKTCSACGAEAMDRLGYGTEQVQEVVQARFPQARVARLDRDTADGDGLETLLAQVRSREIDIVVGTQMITKGHDFPSVTLVGVVLADHGMGLPDFRASERTFQLLSQVAGRAGRGVLPGRVLVQTYNPVHPAITCARDHDYARFFELEKAARDELGYPPALRLACVRIDGADPQLVRQVAQRGAEAARALASRAPPDEQAEVLGPSEAPLSRLKGRTRWQLFVKARSPHVLRRVAMRAADADAPRGVRVSVDIDPASTL